jgi:hypothetical protein
MFWRILAAVLILAAAVAAGVMLAAPAPAATRAPIILVVPRSQVVHEMQAGYWCTRERPGWFTCTAVSPG